MANSFHCSVVTPEGAILSSEAEFVAFPAHDGEVGVLPNHAPFLMQLGVGALRVRNASIERQLYVDGGFAQFLDNRLNILTEDAKLAEKLDAEVVERLLAEAEAIRVTDSESFELRRQALERARVQQRLLRARS